MNQQLRLGRAAALLNVSLVLLMLSALSVQAQGDRDLGLVGDEGDESVHVFDLNTNTVITTVDLPSVGSAVGDVAISQDGTLGFVTTFAADVYVVDLTQSTPVLASGTNPIPISNPGEDFAVTPDGNYLLVSDGSTVNPLSVVDINSRAEVDTENLTGSDHNNVDVCDDGVTVLAGGVNVGVVASGIFNPATGTLTATGNSVPAFALNNVYCAPGSQSGIAITRHTGELRSFTIGPGGTLTFVESVSLGGGSFGISGVFTSDGTTFYARYQTGQDAGEGFVAGFEYDPATGNIFPGPGDLPSPVFTVHGTPTFFGMDQLTISDDDSQLYVSDNDQVSIFDATTGAVVGSITDADFNQLTGITGRREAPLAEVECPTMFAINDFDSDQGNPDTEEFVELQTNPNEDLLGLYLVFFDGSNSDSYFTTALTGSADASGTYTVANPGVAGADQTFPDNTLQDGPDAIAVTKAFVAPGTDASVPSSPFPGDVCASIVYINDDMSFITYSTGGGVARGTSDSGDQHMDLGMMLQEAVKSASAGTEETAAPTEVALDAAYPNPFASRTTIGFALEEAGPASLVIYDALGREVRRLVDGELAAGSHRVVWDGLDAGGASLASGVYIYRLTTNGVVLTRQTVLLK